MARSESGELIRRPSEVLRRGYLDEEVRNLFALGRLWIEAGDMRGAETIFKGLITVVPDFAPAWLGLAYCQVCSANLEGAADSARVALKVAADSVEAMLFLACCLLTLGDFNSAGTLLGEVAERVESGQVMDSNLIRFFRLQLARFHNR